MSQVEVKPRLFSIAVAAGVRTLDGVKPRRVNSFAEFSLMFSDRNNAALRSGKLSISVDQMGFVNVHLKKSTLLFLCTLFPLKGGRRGRA